MRPLKRTSPGRVTASLLQLAGILDLALSAVAARLAMLALGVQWRDTEAVAIIAAVAVLVHWLVIEVLLQGRSVGRAALGLELHAASGGHPGPGAGLRRFLGKVFGFWRGWTPGQVAPYHARSGEVWRVALLPGLVSFSGGSSPAPTPGPSSSRIRGRPDWKLQIGDGPHRGKTLTLRKNESFRDGGVLRIGRDPIWADLDLSGSPKVSRRHAELRSAGDSLELWDVGTYGRGSTYGSTVHGQRVPPGMGLDIGNADHIKVADVILYILR